MPNGNQPSPAALATALEALQCALADSPTRLRWECAVNGSTIDLLAWDDARYAFAAAHDVEPVRAYDLTAAQAEAVAALIDGGERVEWAVEAVLDHAAETAAIRRFERNDARNERAVGDGAS